MPDLQTVAVTGREAILKEAAVKELKASLRGRLLLATDGAYEEARKVWNSMIDKRPALIAQCAGVGDVVEAVNFARDNNLLVSVRGGGHNVAGKSVCDGGLMIDLSNMRSVQVDRDQRTARVEGGAALSDLDHQTQAFGLATTAGVVPTTGVAGLTLGGGVGWLARKYGLSCDNLLSVEIVTANGRILRASPDENADLFWAVRGGSGNFGVVTSLQYQLHPVSPMVLAGSVFYPLAKAREAMRFYHEFSSTAPDELCAGGALITLPDGEQVFAVNLCYCGSMEQGERVLQPLRQFGTPLSDQIAPMAYTDLQAKGDERFPIGLNYYWKSHFMKEISDDAIDLLVSYFPTVPSPLTALGFQQYGGAISRVGPSETAFGQRDAQYDFIPACTWSDPNDAESNMQWAREIWEMMKPFATGGEYVNNLGEEGEERVKAAYGVNHERLVALKNKYDPENFFRLNANIKPTV